MQNNCRTYDRKKNTKRNLRRTIVEMQNNCRIFVVTNKLLCDNLPIIEVCLLSIPVVTSFSLKINTNLTILSDYSQFLWYNTILSEFYRPLSYNNINRYFLNYKLLFYLQITHTRQFWIYFFFSTIKIHIKTDDCARILHILLYCGWFYVTPLNGMDYER